MSSENIRERIKYVPELFGINTVRRFLPQSKKENLQPYHGPIVFLRFTLSNFRRKIMKKLILTAVSVIATLIAAVVSTGACFWFLYQPNEPKSLNN